MDKKKINILIVGSEKKWAIENFYIKYLREQGADVSSFTAHDIFDDYYHQSIFTKLLTRAKISGIYTHINRQLLELVNTHSFDLIWVFKGMEIYPQTLIKLRQQDIKLVNYNPDHPFIHTFRGSGNAYVRNSVGLYDAHFCYSLPVLHKIESEYRIPCAWLPFAYEPSPFSFPAEKEELVKACFIGNPDPYRAEAIQQLNNAGVEIDVYGNNWHQFLTPSATLQLFPAIYKADFNQVATRYRLQLNLFRPHNDNSHNMRTFEMPGLGCIVLAPDSKEHRLLFENGKEVMLYTTHTDMAVKAQDILKLPFATADVMRQAAYQRGINSGYTYKARAQQVHEWMQQIINGTFPFHSNQYI